MIVKNIDFTGDFAIPYEVPFFQGDDDTFIESQEKKYLTRLLGKSAFNELQNNLMSKKWQKLINGFDYEVQNYTFFQKGLKEMLLNFIYYEVYESLFYKPSSSGLLKVKYENAEEIDYNSALVRIQEQFNQGLKIYNNLNIWLYQNNNLINRQADAISDNGDGTYTFSVSDTENLLNYSKIKTNQGYFVIDNLIDDTSFEIKAETGLSFNLDFSFHLYNEILTGNLAYKQIVNY